MSGLKSGCYSTSRVVPHGVAMRWHQAPARGLVYTHQGKRVVAAVCASLNVRIVRFRVHARIVIAAIAMIQEALHTVVLLALKVASGPTAGKQCAAGCLVLLHFCGSPRTRTSGKAHATRITMLCTLLSKMYYINSLPATRRREVERERPPGVALTATPR